MDITTLQQRAWDIAEAQGHHDNLRAALPDARSAALAGLVEVYARLGALAQDIKRHGVSAHDPKHLRDFVNGVTDSVTHWLWTVHNGETSTPPHYATLLRLVLLQTEVSEASEVADNPALLADELADILIRTGDLAHGLGIPLAQATVRKLEKNLQRPYRYGTPWEQAALSADRKDTA